MLRRRRRGAVHVCGHDVGALPRLSSTRGDRHGVPSGSTPSWCGIIPLAELVLVGGTYVAAGVRTRRLRRRRCGVSNIRAIGDLLYTNYFSTRSRLAGLILLVARSDRRHHADATGTAPVQSTEHGAGGWAACGARRWELGRGCAAEGRGDGDPGLALLLTSSPPSSLPPRAWSASSSTARM